MNPATLISAFTSAVQLAAELAPQLQTLFQSGQITADQQAQIQATLANLEAQGFSGPEWVPST